MSEKADAKKMIESFGAYIQNLESLRHPINLCNTIYSFISLFKLVFKKGKLSYFIINNPEMYQKTQEELDPYFRKVVDINFKVLTIILLIWLFILPISCLMFSNFFDINELLSLLLTVIIASLSSILFVILIYTKRKRIAGEKYDTLIKKIIEDLIYNRKKLIIENDLNPNKFPLKLKHKDYQV